MSKTHIYIKTDEMAGHLPVSLLEKEILEMYVEMADKIFEHKLNNDYLYLEKLFIQMIDI